MRRALKLLAGTMAVLAGLAFGGCASVDREGPDRLDGRSMDPAANF